MGEAALGEDTEMSKMSELSAQQDVLDMIDMSKPKRARYDAFMAVETLVNIPDRDLRRHGVTASQLKTMVDMLIWKMCFLHAEKQKEKEALDNVR